MGSTCCSNSNKEKEEKLVFDNSICDDNFYNTYVDLEISHKITNLQRTSLSLRASSSTEYIEHFERKDIQEKIKKVAKYKKFEQPKEEKLVRESRHVKLIRLQAFIKGFLIRKKTKKSKVRFRVPTKGSQRSNDKLTKTSTIKSTSSVKDYIESSDDIISGNPADYCDNIRRYFSKIDFSDSKDLLKTITEKSFFNSNKPLLYYTGQWLNCKFDGFGTLHYTDNSFLTGHFRHGTANGVGKFNNFNGDYYLGEWVNDRVNGLGMFKSKSNNTYMGEWRNDKQQGFGTETWKEGNYIGEYKDKVKSGIGELTLSDSSHYVGEFRDNQIDGVGKMTFKDGRVYSGTWKNNKMCGYGIMTWFEEKGKSVLYRHSSGNSKEIKFYEGEFFNDAKHGSGVMYKDGKYYIGVWIQNKLDGEVLVIDFNIGKNMNKNNFKNCQYKHGKYTRDLETKSLYLNLAFELGYIKNID